MFLNKNIVLKNYTLESKALALAGLPKLKLLRFSSLQGKNKKISLSMRKSYLLINNFDWFEINRKRLLSTIQHNKIPSLN
jgi:hypothetical protein